MIKHTYRLKLATPAFLGDAAQQGVWRTPPLKALIREWWRIAVAPSVGYDANELKALEKALFGTAADEAGGDNRRSKIRLALEHWREGTCKTWPTGERRVTHPEVKDQVGSELYLGYGPLHKSRTSLKNGAALQADETNTLHLALPAANGDELQCALTLAHWFGTVGGRSRNGWGSLAWQAEDGTLALPALSLTALEKTGRTRPLHACLELDWPHAIGRDDKSMLVWQSVNTFANWHEAMEFLAKTKISFRVELGFKSGDNSPNVEPRHVIAYPVTKHNVKRWGRDARLANTLRFKLHTGPDNRLQALIYHTPCKPTLPHDGVDLLDTWQRVHAFLDAQTTLARLA